MDCSRERRSRIFQFLYRVYRSNWRAVQGISYNLLFGITSNTLVCLESLPIPEAPEFHHEGFVPVSSRLMTTAPATLTSTRIPSSGPGLPQAVERSRQSGCSPQRGQGGAGERKVLSIEISGKVCSDTADERCTAEKRNDLLGRSR